MGRRKPAWLQQREADLAKARETYYANRTRTTSTTVVPRAKTLTIYSSLLIQKAGVSALFEVQASEKALIFFGGGGTAAAGMTALGLQLPSAVTDVTAAKPRNLKPSHIQAMVGAATPTASNTPWGSRVIKYSTATTGTSQAHYSAPISNGTTTPTVAALDAKSETIFNAVKTNLGDATYARFYFHPEQIGIAKN